MSPTNGNGQKPLLLASKVDLCPVRESAKILGKKWHLVIVHRLLEKPMGFNELKEAVGEVSAKILSQSLSDLQDNEIVNRKVHSESPVRVEYSLTEKGEDLRNVLENLYAWGRRWDVCERD